MAKTSNKSPEEKLRVVLSVLPGELSAAAAGEGVSEQTVHNWKRLFLHAGRESLAQARRAVFVQPPTRPNRVWQMDFSAFEAAGRGTLHLGGVIDYLL